MIMHELGNAVICMLLNIHNNSISISLVTCFALL